MKDTTSTAQPQVEAARLSLGANIFLVVIKITAGLASGSLSVIAEGVQSLLDIFASAAILVSVKAANSPPDDSHPWGHGKLENMVSLGQMLLMLGSIGGIWWAAWQRWMTPHPAMPRVDWGAAALLVSVGVNLAVSARISSVAKATQSSALAAEAVHLRGDLWSCVGVLAGLGATYFFNQPRLDPLFAGVMGGVAAYSALKLGRDILRPLLDEKLPADEEECIRQVLKADPRVLGFHKLRTRQAGSFKLADVHLLLDDELSFCEAHRITEEVEAEIRAALPNLDIIVHAEPFHEETQHQIEAHPEHQGNAN